jgi:DHA1 family bicyclomycin/chloramphenicol resistance-like MFS transporter
VIQPGTRAFTILLSAAMAMTALAIDTLLPAFDDVRAEFGLAPDATQVAGLVTSFIVGFGLGQLPAGILADRYGRRPVLWGGLAIYMVGAAAAALAPSLGLMIAARFLWGLGAAGPRVAVMAMVRDSYSGAAMARQMSSIMAIFLIVPMIAPAIGAGLIALGPWQLTIWLCVATALLVLVASTYLPPTLPVTDRRAFSARAMVADWKIVLSTPGTLGWIAATVVMTGTFMSYIASSENIVDEVFGLKRWFVVTFAAVALVMAGANLLNGRVVETLGLRRILTVMPFVQILTAAALCVAALATGGTPPFAVFLTLVILVMVSQQVLMVNINSAAMVPLGHIAGSAAAVIGAAPMVFGSLIGSQIDARFDGTVTPLSVAFLVGAVLSGLAVRHALRVTRSTS